MANLIYLGRFGESDSVLHAYDFDGNAQSASDQDLSSHSISGFKAGAATDTHIYINNGIAFDHNFNRQSDDDVTFDINPIGLAATENRLIAVSSTGTVEFRSFDGTLHSSEGFTLSTPLHGAWLGAAATSDRIIFLGTQLGANSHAFVRFYTHDRVHQASENLIVTSSPPPFWDSVFATDNRIFFLNRNNEAVAYNFSRVRQSSDDFTILSNTQCSFVVFEQPVTVTLTAPSLYATVQAEISVTTSADVTGLIESDFTVTGATVDDFIANSATSYTLKITPAAGAGTVRIQLPADSVEPGNVAVDESFTRNAVPTIAITFDDTEGVPGGTTGVTFTGSEAITGFVVGDC